MGPFIYQLRKMGQSYTVFLEKGGLLIVYLAALKKGAIRAAHPYHVLYRDLPPPPSCCFTVQEKQAIKQSK